MQNPVRKPKLHRLPCVKPALRIHQMGNPCPAHARLDLIGIHDTLLHLVQHLPRPLHLLTVPNGNRHRIVDHHHAHRRHQNLRPRHGDHRRRRSRQSVHLHPHVPLILHQHVINPRRRKHIPARRIDPDRDIPRPCIQLLLEQLRRHLVPIPGLIRNLPVQNQRPLPIRLIPYPVPKLPLHPCTSLSAFSKTSRRSP